MLPTTHLKKLVMGKVNEKTMRESNFVYKISINPFVNTHLAEVLVSVNGQKLKALLDLGATKSVINRNVSFLKEMTINTTYTKLQCANGKY